VNVSLAPRDFYLMEQVVNAYSFPSLSCRPSYVMEFKIGRLPVLARYDSSASVSCVSHDVLRELHGLSQHSVTGTISLPVSVSQSSRFTFTCIMPLTVSACRGVVLGLDWFALFREHLLSFNLQPPSPAAFNPSDFQPQPRTSARC
jgi:hypothetical protein